MSASTALIVVKATNTHLEKNRNGEIKKKKTNRATNTHLEKKREIKKVIDKQRDKYTFRKNRKG